MMIHYNAPGKKRKELARKIGAWIGADVQYAGAPTFAYHIDTLVLDRDSNLTFGALTDSEAIERLQQYLYDEGFECESSEELSEASCTPEIEEGKEDQVALTVAVPSDSVGVGNLTNLLEAKGQLIRKALGIEDLRIQVEADTVSFPWFDSNLDAETLNVYTRFISAICKMSKDQKRINPKEKEVENEKYAFRCFLLRLGFIGNEYKTERKILLRNLSGSAAFKGGQAKEVAVCE